MINSHGFKSGPVAVSRRLYTCCSQTCLAVTSSMIWNCGKNREDNGSKWLDLGGNLESLSINHYPVFCTVIKYSVSWQFAVYLSKLWTFFNEILSTSWIFLVIWNLLLLLMAYSSRAWPCPRCGASPPAQKLFSTQKKDQCSEVSGLPPPNVTRCDWVSLRAFSNPKEACVLWQQWHDGDLHQESWNLDYDYSRFLEFFDRFLY